MPKMSIRRYLDLGRENGQFRNHEPAGSSTIEDVVSSATKTDTTFLDMHKNRTDFIIIANGSWRLLLL